MACGDVLLGVNDYRLSLRAYVLHKYESLLLSDGIVLFPLLSLCSGWLCPMAPHTQGMDAPMMTAYLIR